MYQKELISPIFLKNIVEIYCNVIYLSSDFVDQQLKQLQNS